MKAPMKVLLILILFTFFVLDITAVIICMRSSRHSARNTIIDGDVTDRPVPPRKFELPDIPESAALNSLNWGQSSSNEYECFSFDLNRDENSYKLSGRYVDPESGRRIDLEDVLLNDEQLKSVEKILKSGKFRCYTERISENNVYDEADSLLSAGWRLSDGSIISVKYNGIAAKELFKVLKVLLRQ